MKAFSRRDLLVCLSLANLSLMEIWRRLIFANQFLLPRWSWRDLLATAIALVLFTAILSAVVWLGRATPLRRVALDRWVFLLPVVVFLNLCRNQFPNQTSQVLRDPNFFAYLALLAIVAVSLLVRFHRWIGGAAEIAALCILPFLPIMIVQASWRVEHEPPGKPLAGRVHGSSPAPRRFVWIIYDEADWRYLDPLSRPAGLRLPELDRMMSESVWTDNAIQSGIQTGGAIPSLIYGQSLQVEQFQGTARLTTAADHPKPVDWLKESNVFSWARSQGLDATIVGWYLPYCRVLASVLSDCYWEPIDTRVRSFEPSLATSLKSVLRSLWPLEDRQRHLLRYERLLRESIEDATDPTLSLVLLHLPMPHEPVIYDRNPGRLTIFNFRKDWYLDNLVLGDRILGDIRHAMEQAGLWDRSTVLVTSDHALRWYAGWNEESSPRIPYVLKLAGQTRGIEYHNHFHTLFTRDLIQAYLLGQLHTNDDVVGWLDQHSKPVPPAATGAIVRMRVPGSQ
jgi:hypothetical protein